MDAGESVANHVWIEIKGVRIYSCYFSPNIEYNDFLSQLDDLEESIRTASNGVLVTGDFNSKSPEWGSRKLDKRGDALSEMIARLNLVVLNEGNANTFRRGNTGSVIDITFASADIAALAMEWRVLEDFTLSDHQYIEFHIKAESRRRAHQASSSSTPTKNDGWVLRKLDKIKLEEYLKGERLHKNLQRIVELGDLGALISYATSTITAACNVSMPRRNKSTAARKPVYWWTPEIAELRKKCISARRKTTRCKNRDEYPICQQAFKEARKELRTAIKSSKRRCWLEICRSVDQDPWGLPYKIVTKKLLGSQQIPGLSCPTRMATIVRTLFPAHQRRPTVEREDKNANIRVELFTFEELREAGKRLQHGKSPGPDSIPNEVIRAVLEVWPELLLETFNLCLSRGIFPKQWKRQKLVLLKKSNKPAGEPTSYRPICLLDTMGKLFERMLLRRLQVHIDDNGGLSPSQYGFRKGRSTVDAIMKVIDEIKGESGIRQSRGFSALITLDIRNAFNTARWDRILEALKRINTPEYLQRMIDSYLADRILMYDTDDGIIEVEVSAGVPQGSVLGPFLWNAMYDDLLNLKLPGTACIVGFADDIGVVVTAKTIRLLEILVNECLRRASNWLKANGLEMAVHKTEALLVTDRRGFTMPTIVLENQNPQWGKSLRYLGVQLDGRLRYIEHVNRIAEKAETAAVALARLMPNIGGPSEAKRRLLNSVTHSKILYAAEVWGGAMENVGARRRLTGVQRRSALRVISGFRTVSTEAALVLASTPPIDLLIREKREIYNEVNQGDQSQQTELQKKTVKKRARQRLMERWQTRWDSGSTGRWTYQLIPKIAPWYDRPHGQMEYHLTQILTGHGCFNAYLEKFKKTESAACLHCNHCPDDAGHTIFECSASEEDRKNLEKITGVNLTTDSLIPLMLSSEEYWTAMSAFITKTMKVKRKMEEADRAQRALIATAAEETAPEPLIS